MTPASVPAPATAPGSARPARVWAASFAAFVAMTSALAWVGHAAPSLELEILALMLLYLSVACTFLPLPTLWIVLWAARETAPIPVALVATVGTCIANLHDYHIVNGLCRLGPFERARRSRGFARAEAWFRRAPFASLAAASFLPLPVDVVRLLAASVGYPRRAFVLATFTGRLPRYLVVAVIGHELRPSNRTLLAILAVLAVIALAKGAPHLRERWRTRRAGASRACQP